MNEFKETPRYEVKKVKIKNDQLTVDYTEVFDDSNFSNEITKSSEQYVHDDLKYALSRLKVHVAAICEMPEAGSVNVSEPSDGDLNSTLEKIVVTGYSKGGSGDGEGACITAQRILKTGQVLNITTPFTKFEDETGDGYGYGAELGAAIRRCDYEVDAYLFEEKWGVKQLSLDFDGEETTEEKPKRRGRKKKAAAEGFDVPQGDAESEISDVEFEEMPLQC
jgi:hypothetical protein